jgi:hypothetical protein
LGSVEEGEGGGLRAVVGGGGQCYIEGVRAGPPRLSDVEVSNFDFFRMPWGLAQSRNSHFGFQKKIVILSPQF